MNGKLKFDYIPDVRGHFLSKLSPDCSLGPAIVMY